MLTVVAAILKRGGEILVCQRSAEGSHPLKWEFPGGKVEEGEELETALLRELREELGIEAVWGQEIARYEYTYPGRVPILLVFASVTEWKGTIENRVFHDIQWCPRERLTEFDFIEGDSVLIELIRKVHVDQIE